MQLPLLYGLLAARSRAAAAAALRGLDAAEWKLVMHEVQAHKVAGLLWARLSGLDLLGELPPDVRDALLGILESTRRRNERILDQRRQMETRLGGAVPFLALKGVRLIDTLYDDLSLRPMEDIDLLVRPEHAGTVTLALRELGYTQPDLVDGVDPAAHHLPPFVRPDCAPIEVHTSLLGQGSPFALNYDGLWQRSVAQGDLGMRYLSLEDEALYLCIHATSHHGLDIGLYAFQDIRRLLDSPELDWETVWQRAREWRVERCLIVTLIVLRAALDVDLADRAGVALPDGLIPARIRRDVLAALCYRRCRTPAKRIAHLIAGLDHAGGWAAFAGAAGRQMKYLAWPASAVPARPKQRGFATARPKGNQALAGVIGQIVDPMQRQQLRARLAGIRVKRWLNRTAGQPVALLRSGA